MDYANQAIELANELDFESGIFGAYNQKGLVYYNLSQHDSALKYFELARPVAEKRNDPKQLSTLYSNFGNSYGDIGQYKKCLQYYKLSSLYTEKSGQSWKLTYLQVNIGTIYSVLEQHDSAMVYYESALKKMLAADSTDEKLYIVYGNIGATSLELGDTLKAEIAFRNAHRIAVMYDNHRALAASFDYIGIIEFYKGNHDTAFHYLRSSLRYGYEIESGQAVASTSLHVGTFFRQLGIYDSAMYYLNRGLQVATEIKDYITMDDYYTEISLVFEKTGQADSALYYYKKLFDVRALLDSLNENDLVGQMKTEMESERREQEITLLKEQDEKKNIILYSSIVLGVLVLALGIVAFSRYLQKKRSAMILQKQKDEIEEQKEIIEEKNKDITDSIRYAKRIQNAILPTREKMQAIFPETWCCFMPRDIVSGDFYWFEQEQDYKLFGVVDCTGHGVPGALLSVVGHNILGKALTDLKLVKPDEILGLLDLAIHRTLRHKNEDVNSIQDGMDVALCCYHEKTQTLYYSGSFNPLYIIRQGQILETKADKIFIGSGLSNTKSFTLHEIKIEKGDEVVLFSDGYADQFGGPFGKKMKYKPFKELLLTIANKPMNEQVEIVTRSFEEWKRNFDQVDDVCVVAVRL